MQKPPEIDNASVVPPRRRLYLGSLALLIAAGAGAVGLYISELHRTDTSAGKIKMESIRAAMDTGLSFDFGVLRPGAEITHEFMVSNAGVDTLKFLRVESSCSCLAVLEFAKEIMPGKTGSVKLLYKAPAPGAARAEVLIETNRVGGHLIQLQWKGLVANPANKQEVPAAFYISMAELDGLRSGKTAPVLLDVRPQSKFERLSISGALHFPTHVLKTLGFLKDRHVILISEGHQDDELLKEMAQLQERGVASVRILAGGLRAWMREGKALSGSLAGMAEVMTIPPSQFDGWAGGNGWTVIQASAAADGKEKNAAGIAGAKTLNYNPAWTKEQWQESLSPLLAGRAGLEQVLFVSDQGEHYRIIEEAVSALKSKNIFYLEGGLAGFKKWAQFQAALRESKTVTMAASGNASASGASNVVRANAGCATCPQKR